MAALSGETGLSPLDQVRQVEAEVTRRVAAAREAAGRSVERARAQAAQLKSQARQAGRQEGQGFYKTIVARAEEEARAITTQAQNRAADLRRRGYQQMELAVRQAVEIILGLEEERKPGE